MDRIKATHNGCTHVGCEAVQPDRAYALRNAGKPIAPQATHEGCTHTGCNDGISKKPTERLVFFDKQEARYVRRISPLKIAIRRCDQ